MLFLAPKSIAHVKLTYKGKHDETINPNLVNPYHYY